MSKNKSSKKKTATHQNMPKAHQKGGLPAQTGTRAGGTIYVDVDGNSPERNFF
jgi:hypothetical protein